MKTLPVYQRGRCCKNS